MNLATLTAVLLSLADENLAEAPPPDDFAGYTARHHFELTMGFLGGVRDETRAGYTFSSGSAQLGPGAEAIVTPFALTPYDRTIVYGLGWETRYVANHLRFTMGLQKPFASFRMMDALSPSEAGIAGTRSLTLWDIRLGLGVEHAFRYAAPFVDVIGDAQYVNAALTIDTRSAQFKAWSFGFVVRAGVRIHVGEGLFIAPMGEVGIGGPVIWAAGLQAGWVLPLSRS